MGFLIMGAIGYVIKLSESPAHPLETITNVGYLKYIYQSTTY